MDALAACGRPHSTFLRVFNAHLIIGSVVVERRVGAGAGTQQQSSWKSVRQSRRAHRGIHYSTLAVHTVPQSTLRPYQNIPALGSIRTSRDNTFAIRRPPSDFVTRVIQCCDLYHVIFSYAQTIVLTGEIIYCFAEVYHIFSGVSKLFLSLNFIIVGSLCRNFLVEPL